MERAAFALKRLGLRVRVAPPAADSRAADRRRADDLNAFFADPAIKAVVPLRGGWGCSRVLEHLDYALVARQPKVVTSGPSAFLRGAERCSATWTGS